MPRVSMAPDPAADHASATDRTFTRRAFVLRALSAIGVALAAALAVPLGGLAAGPVLNGRPRWPLLGDALPPTPRITGWRSLGPIGGFDVGDPRLLTMTLPVEVEGAINPTPIAVYVVRTGDASAAILDIHCTHMGCPVSWSRGAQRYLCPCHGGAFTAEGARVAGPPPRPMDRYQTVIANQEVWMGSLIEPD